MRRLNLLIALAAVGALAACTQGSPSGGASDPSVATNEAALAPPETENVEAVVSQLEREWVSAIVKKDSVTIDRLLAEEFAGTSPTAHAYTKRMAIDDLKNGAFVVTSMNLDEIAVNSYGNVAVAFASQDEKSTYDGKDISGHYHYTDVWVKKDGRWQAVASHGTRYDRGHAN
jgi:ketosteroid isomerase-like protein